LFWKNRQKLTNYIARKYNVQKSFQNN